MALDPRALSTGRVVLRLFELRLRYYDDRNNGCERDRKEETATEEEETGLPHSHPQGIAVRIGGTRINPFHKRFREPGSSNCATHLHSRLLITLEGLDFCECLA